MGVDENRLPLTAFEHLMWADDRKETPMVFYIRLSLSGEFDLDRFTRSIRSALPRHPLLQCLACGKPSRTIRHLYWKPLENLVKPFIQSVQGSEDFQSPGEQAGIDITQEIGVRFFIRTDKENTAENQSVELLVQFHHAVVDARGGCQFLEDVLVFYHAETESESPQKWLRPLNKSLLKARGEFQLSRAGYRKRRWLDRRKICSYFCFCPEKIYSKSEVSASNKKREICSSRQFSISGSRFDELVSYAKSKSVTLNDVLLRDLFLTINQWNNYQSNLNRKKKLRLMMPTDMRVAGDEEMPASNVLSLCSLDRKPSEIDSSDEFLEKVSQETTFLKNNFMGMALIRSIRFFSNLRSGFDLLMKPNFIYPCHMTAMLSNLGIPLKKTLLPKNEQGQAKAGNLIVEGWGLMPPYRPNSPLSVGVGTEGKCLRVTFHYNAKVMSLQDAQELCTVYETHLNSHLKNIC